MQADTGSVRGGIAVVHGDDTQQAQRERPLRAVRQRFPPGACLAQHSANARGERAGGRAPARRCVTAHLVRRHTAPVMKRRTVLTCNGG